MSNELNHCPFCGSLQVALKNSVIEGRETFFVKCKNEDCWAFGPINSSSEGAVEFWNRSTGGECSSTDGDYRRGYQHGYQNALHDAKRFGFEPATEHLGNTIAFWRAQVATYSVPPSLTHEKTHESMLVTLPYHLYRDTQEPIRPSRAN